MNVFTDVIVRALNQHLIMPFIEITPNYVRHGGMLHTAMQPGQVEIISTQGIRVHECLESHP